MSDHPVPPSRSDQFNETTKRVKDHHSLRMWEGGGGGGLVAFERGENTKTVEERVAPKIIKEFNWSPALEKLTETG